MPLDPQAQSFLDGLAALDRPALMEIDVATARVNAEALVALQGEPEPVAETVEFSIAGPGGEIPIRVHLPVRTETGADSSLIVYFHGGGWTIGSVDLMDRPCRALANAAGSPVASVEYRLAPEHPFPAAVEDAYAAVAWLGDHAPEFGADPGRTVVAGDSAGGNLAAVTALTARDRRTPQLAGQVLLFPVTAAPAHGFPSYDEMGDGYMLTADDMHWFWGHYMGGQGHDADPRAAPLQAPDLAGLPPALVMVAGYDPLRDEGLAYADRLKDAGVEVTVQLYEEQMHDFLWIMGAVDAGRQAVNDIAAFVTNLPI